VLVSPVIARTCMFISSFHASYFIFFFFFSLTTSINQCLLKGDVTVSGQSNPVPRGKHEFFKVDWVHHNNIAYSFFESTTVSLNNDVQNGSWAEIGAGSSTPVSKSFF